MVLSVDDIPVIQDSKNNNVNKMKIEEKWKLQLIDFEEEIKRLNKESLDSTRRMVDDVDRAHELGIETLTKLDDQEEVLDDIERNMTHVNDHMKIVQKNVRKMSRMRWLPRKLFMCIPRRDKSKLIEELEEAYQRPNTSNHHFSISSYTAEKPSGFIERLHDDLHEEENEMEENMVHVSRTVETLRKMAVDVRMELEIQDPQIKRVCALVGTGHDAVGGANKEVQKLLQ